MTWGQTQKTEISKFSIFGALETGKKTKKAENSKIPIFGLATQPLRPKKPKIKKSARVSVLPLHYYLLIIFITIFIPHIPHNTALYLTQYSEDGRMDSGEW